MANLSSAVASREVRTEIVPSAFFPRTGFALSGGGAKGSFEVGALKYLMRAAGVHPDVITCTSVGAVNGMKLAEGEGAPIQVNGHSQGRGLDGLEQLWLSFKSPSEMYAPSEALSKLSLDYYSAIPLLMGQVGNQLMGKAVPLIAGGVSLLTFLGPLGGLFLPFLNTGPLETELHQLQAVVDGSSFFTLEPIGAIYDRGNPDKHLVAGSKIELIFATVGLTSGELRYVRLVGMDHQGRLVGDLVGRDQVGSHLPPPSSVTAPVDMKVGMLASAAAPFMFEPQQLAAHGEQYTDGGVRELVPLQAAIDRGSRRVFAIDCNAPYPAAGSQAPHHVQPPVGLLGIGLDVLAILLDEVGLGDVTMPSTDVAWVWHVQPHFEVEGDMEIDTGAIRVNIDYGYMCAFDAVDGSARTVPRRAGLASIGERIAMQRRDISDRERCLRWIVETWALRDKYQDPKDAELWKAKLYEASLPIQSPPENVKPTPEMVKEALVKLLDYHRFADNSDRDLTSRVANLTADIDLGAGYFPSGFGVSDDAHYLDNLISDKPPSRIDHATALATLQSMKCALQPLYQARLDLAGPRSVPPSPDDPTAPDQPWLRWERPDSGAFFGDVWPDGPSCDVALDAKTQFTVASTQVEAKGTSGWAIESGAASGAFPNRVQLLIPQDQSLLHVSGSFEPTGATISPWLAASGTKWVTAWETNKAGPLQLDGAAKWVTCTPVPDTPFASLAAVVLVQRANDPNESLLELAFDGAARAWSVVGPIVVAGEPISDITGNPVVFQSTYAQQESLELLVPMGDHVGHFYRELGSGAWVRRSDGIPLADPATTSPPPSGPAAPAPVSAYAVACFQSNYGAPANLEAVVAVENLLTSTVSSLEAYFFDAWSETWRRIGPVTTADGPIKGISGDPVMFQSKAGTRGDFELLVPAGDVVHHLFRDNDAGMVWKRRGNGIAFGGGTGGSHGGPTVVSATPVAVAAYQSIDGVIGKPNLEAIIRIRPPIVQQDPSEFFEARVFDYGKQAWQSAGQITIEGSPVHV